MSSKAFMGRGISFPIRLDPQTGRFAMSEAEDNIKESVGLIIHTFRWERVMRPEFGAMSESVLFSDSGAEVLTALETGVRVALEESEPRIMDVRVEASRDLRIGAVNIIISYRVRTTNNQFNQVYPFYVFEGEGS